MNDVALQKHVILMKSSLTLLVEASTADTIAAALGSQSGHTFFRIKELGETINSAEIEGIYSPSKYEELLKMKGGEYKCAFERWHKKREICTCKFDLAKEREDKLKEIRRKAESAAITPAQRAEASRIAKKMRIEMEASGVLSPSSRPVLKRSKLNEYRQMHGRDYDVPRGFKIEEDV